MRTFRDILLEAEGFIVSPGCKTEIKGFITDEWVDRSIVPTGWYAYDIREGDSGYPCTIEERVIVNHYGTFLTRTKIDLGSKGYRSLRGRGGYTYDDTIDPCTEIGEVVWNVNVNVEKQDALWFGGLVAVAKNFNGYDFGLFAIGDVVATLYGDDGKEVEYVKDKNNSGLFSEIFGEYFKSDVELAKAERSGRLVIENNNWFEVLACDPSKKVWLDLDWVTNSNGVYDAAREMLANMNDMAEQLKKREAG